MSKITVFWFRRDLRLSDNVGLAAALLQPRVQPLFIFDTLILSKVHDRDDPRIGFILSALENMQKELRKFGAEIWVRIGEPLSVFQDLVKENKIAAVYANHDYEPYPRKRDAQVGDFLRSQGIPFYTFKDQCLFEKNEILSGSGKPYTVYTPYRKKHLSLLTDSVLQEAPSLERLGNLAKAQSQDLPPLEGLGFFKSSINVPKPEVEDNLIANYHNTRDIPMLERGTSRLGVHLRFGTISVRGLARRAKKLNSTFLSELIWRDFFMQILWHNPRVDVESFRPEYDKIAWRDDEENFLAWCQGRTGYPLVDAGMRELLATGYMHNRVRMVVASFLCKHLLIHWRKGERWFARKLLDYDKAANNGNWQWACGSGCDAAPYFRIFNPEAQQKKFDPNFTYIKKWVPEWGTPDYPAPIVEHEFARKRAILEYSKAVKNFGGGR
ncbi:MAG: DNA photolyase family protein [Bdellovibrionaceae bacterium]|nr:DNA photolyase family protein [Pseudobdellovibrionaceae bacterium]